MAFILELFFKRAEEEDIKRAQKGKSSDSDDVVDVNAVTLTKSVETLSNVSKGFKNLLPEKK